MNFSIVIPAYNSHRTLPVLISKLYREGINKKRIIVVDDGSNKPYNINGINIIRYDKNRGKGYALRQGFLFSLKKGYDFAITMDADLQHPPEKINSFISNLKKNRMIVGWRKERKNMPTDRKLTNFLASIFTSLYINKKIHDAQCGYRAFPLNILLRRKKFWSNGYEFEVEILCKSKRMEIKEVVIPSIYEKGTSHINKFDIIIKYTKLVWKLLWHL